MFFKKTSKSTQGAIIKIGESDQTAYIFMYR